MANNATNVSFGKPKVGGAIFNAPLGTTLPTSADATLDNAYKCLGYASEDGLTNNNNSSSNKIRAWGGDNVLVAESEKEDTWGTTLIEIMNVDVLKAVYGADNVSGTLAAGIAIKANSKPKTASVWVFDIALSGGAMKRVVLPNGTISELSEITYNDSDAVGYGITIDALPGADGDTHKEYIKGAASGG